MPPLTSSLCRRLLKLYGSCEFAPLLTTENGQSSRVLERIPIPVLHTVKLGPTNHLIDALEEVQPAHYTLLILHATLYNCTTVQLYNYCTQGFLFPYWSR